MTRSAEAQQLSLGVLARSRKPNERRLPIHPAHFSRIDPRVRPRIFLEHGYGSDFGATDDALAEFVGGIGTREPAHRRLRRHSVAQSPGRGSSGTQCGTSRLGLAALRAGCRPDADRHRSAADADRLRGDESLAGRRRVRPARLSQEQRARRLLLRPARHATGRDHRQLRPPAARRRHRVRRDRPRRRHRPERPRR